MNRSHDFNNIVVLHKVIQVVIFVVIDTRYVLLTWVAKISLPGLHTSTPTFLLHVQMRMMKQTPLILLKLCTTVQTVPLVYTAVVCKPIHSTGKIFKSAVNHRLMDTMWQHKHKNPTRPLLFKAMVATHCVSRLQDSCPAVMVRCPSFMVPWVDQLQNFSLCLRNVLIHNRLSATSAAIVNTSMVITKPQTCRSTAPEYSLRTLWREGDQWDTSRRQLYSISQAMCILFLLLLILTYHWC